MQSAKIDPGLSMLLLMTPEELRGLAAEGRMGMTVTDDDAIVTVTIRCVSAEPLAVPVAGVEVTEQQGDIATARMRLSALDALSEREEVLSISPVRGGSALLDRTRGIVGAGITSGQHIRNGAEAWNGTSVTVGIIDLGFDVRHPAFRQFPGGPTRIELFWDRVVGPRPGDTPGPGGVGVLYSRAQIDTFLLGAAAAPPVINPLSMDFDGHGSHVTAIAAGRDTTYQGIAPGASIIAVRIEGSGVGQLHNICNWIFSNAAGPCSINMSLGHHSSGHDGTSDLETGLDDLLRDPATLAPRPGRFMAVAAGNDRVQGWHVKATVLGTGRPRTQLVWVSPDGNTNVDEMVFWYPGLDQVRVRLVSPIAAAVGPNRITHWVQPAPAGCIEAPSPGGFAPTVPGGAPSKRFDFSGGTVAFISQAENLLNGDRQIAIRIQPPAGGGNIPGGLWLLEFEGVNDVPAGGILEGFLRMDVPGAPPNTQFLRPDQTTQSLMVNPGETAQAEVFLPIGVAREVTVVFEYPVHLELEAQVSPPINLGAVPATQFVQHGPAAVADPALTAPAGPAAAAGLPFALGAQTVNVNHHTVAGHRRVTVGIPTMPLFGTPNSGIYRVSFRIINGDRPVPVEARLDQDHHVVNEFAVFRNEPTREVQTEVFPDTCVESVLRFFMGPNAPPEVDLQTAVPAAVPGGGTVEVRVRIPPEDPEQESGGWQFTPWVGPGHAETAVPGSLAAVGGAGAKAYVLGNTEVRIDYPAPAAGAPATINFVLEDTTLANLRRGEWKVEYRGRGTNAPVTVTPRLIHFTDQVSHDGFASQGSPELDRQRFYTHEGKPGLVSIPFQLFRDTSDELRLELLYDSRNNLNVRLRPPAPDNLRFTVGPGNAPHADAGAPAPAATPAGVSANLVGGTTVLIDHPAADVFPGQRRVLVTIRTPAGRTVFHPRGYWRLEVEPVAVPGSPEITARLSASGHATSFIVMAQPAPDFQEDTLRTPSTAREVLTVANGLPHIAPITVLNGESSPGPVRPATWMRLNGNNRQWLNFAKPEITAPGTEIASACSTFTGLWLNQDTPLGWHVLGLPDGRVLSMRATWPVLQSGGRIHTQNVAAAAAAGTLTNTTWTAIIPQGAVGQVKLVFRYPAARAFAVRVQQPAASPAPNRTHGVRPNGTEWAIGGGAAAASTPAPNHPDGAGRLYPMNNGDRVFIRQDGAGQASVILRGRPALTNGEWRLIISHEEAFAGGPVAVTLEAQPPADPLGWPKFNANLTPRETGQLGPAPGAAPATLRIPFTVPPRMAGNVTVRLTYPPPPAGPAAYNFHAVVISPGGGQHTDRVDSNGVVHAEAGSVPTVGPAVPHGARFRFNDPPVPPAGPTPGTEVVIVHNPGRVDIIFSRGPSNRQRILEGEWMIGLLNLPGSPNPPAPVEVTVEIEPGPHDAVFFRLPAGPIPYAFTRFGNLAVGALQEWAFHLSEGRRHPVIIDVVYDSRDTLRLQLQGPNGAAERTEAVNLGDAPVAGALGATLANTGVGADGVSFVSAGHFRATISHQAHPQAAGNRNRIRITIIPDGDPPLPAGDWNLRLDATAIGAGSNGMAEAWIEETLFCLLSGTSMASPHIAGLAALMLQQDHTATHAEIKRRLINTAQPIAITRNGDFQLPSQWDPAAGWGVVDGAKALLEHAGTDLAALGRTTGCPLPCEDNCLLEAVHNNGNVTALIAAPSARHNLSPEQQGADPLPGCPRLADYLVRYHSNPFAGGVAATFEALGSPALSLPLVRTRDQRGTLNNFAAASWEDANHTLAQRLVEQWASTGTVMLIEPRPAAGVVREVMFNRFAHHLHHLLAATNHVTKCSFTTKKKVVVLSPRVPFGSPFSSAASKGLRELFDNHPADFHSRSDLSTSDGVVLWGANLAANAPETWRAIRAARAARGDRLPVFVVDPAMQELPTFARRIAIAPGSDRHLALALMLRMLGNPGHASANRQIPPDPRFADANRGFKQFLNTLSNNLDDFITHVRNTAAAYLQVAGGVVSPDADLFDRCIPGATAAERARLVSDFNAIYEAYLSRRTATILGSGASRYVDGEEHVQYIAALCLLSGNIGVTGGGLSFGEDRNAAWNTDAFAAAHDSKRPEDNSTELGIAQQQEGVNLASLSSDAPENTKVLLWFDLDPLTHLPDAQATQALLGRTQLNVQITSALDDSSRYADIILPLADSLLSWDLQVASRSAWLNLTQPVRTPDDSGPRPMARILHEAFQAIRARLVEEYHDDLKPVIDEEIYRKGPLLLSRQRRQEFTSFFADTNRIPNLLKDRLPNPEVAQIRTRLKNWYEGLHGGEPTTDTDDAVSATNWVNFFNRTQVDWILELLFARHTEREAALLLYNLLQTGTAVDPARFNGNRYGILPDGGTPLGNPVAQGNRLADLKGAAGFAPERAAYRNAVLQVDQGATGRGAFPMRLVMAQARTYPSTHIPLRVQVAAGRVRLPVVVVNPYSPSLAPRLPLANGDRVALVGNVTYNAGGTFETVLAKVELRLDEYMAKETVLMEPGWNGFDRGGQRLMRGIHSEEGETPALFDNLVRVEAENYAPAGNDADRGTRPPKR